MPRLSVVEARRGCEVTHRGHALRRGPAIAGSRARRCRPGGPVVAEDRELRDLAMGDPAQQRYEVLRPVGGDSADAQETRRAGGWAGAGSRMRQLRLARARSRRKSSVVRLRAAADAARPERRILRDWQHVRLSVDGRRARDEPRHARLAPSPSASGIVPPTLIVLQYASGRLALAPTAFRLRAVDDAGDRGSWKIRRSAAASRTSARPNLDRPAAEPGEPREHRPRAVDEVVDDERRVAGLRERDDYVRADSPRLPSRGSSRPWGCITTRRRARPGG